MSRLRDAIAEGIHQRWAGGRFEAGGHPEDKCYEHADAILALPEIVAALKVIEAARAWAGPYRLLVALDQPLTKDSAALLSSVDECDAAGVIG